MLRARTAFAPRPGKTLHRTVLFPRLRVPFDLTKHRGTQRVPLCLVPVVGLSAQIVLCLHSVLRARTAFAPRPGKTLHRTVLFPRLRVPFDLTKHRGTQRVPLCLVPVVGLSAQIVLCLHSVLRARTAFAPRPGKTLHRTVLFPRLRVPFDLTKHRGTQRVPLCLVRLMGLEPIRSPIRPSNVRVCLFRHNRIFHCERYYNSFRCICQHKLCPKVNIFLKLCKFPPFALLQGAKRAAFML